MEYSEAISQIHKAYISGLITKSEYFIKTIQTSVIGLEEETQRLYVEADESMCFRKIECENGWIVFVVKGHSITEVHSNGLVRVEKNWKLSNTDLLKLLEHTALGNELKSQESGHCGIRWPKED